MLIKKDEMSRFFLKIIFLAIHCVLVSCSWTKIGDNTQAQLCRSSLYSPENGQIVELKEESSDTFTVSFRCNPGYRLIGESQIACGKDGLWTGKVPWCKSLCHFVNCTDGMKCILDEELATTRCVCKDIFECPFEYKPVCGSDHVTYANKCILGMTACQKKSKVITLSNSSCPDGIFADASCSQCPKIRICPALYKSEYAFLGELSGLNATNEGIFLIFNVQELYKGLEMEKNISQVTVFKKRFEGSCSCVPFIPSGTSYIFGRYDRMKNGIRVPFFDENTFLEKFYSFEQMNLCWLY